MTINFSGQTILVSPIQSIILSVGENIYEVAGTVYGMDLEGIYKLWDRNNEDRLTLWGQVLHLHI